MSSSRAAVNPDEIKLAALGGVRMVTEIGNDDITFTVEVGDRQDQRHVWKRIVFFSLDDRRHAGGPDFVEAAREQERIAWRYAHAARIVGPRLRSNP
jgi:hypothetical protein